jgi:hypothetical protein
MIIYFYYIFLIDRLFEQDTYLLTNCVACIANMASHLENLHPYAAWSVQLFKRTEFEQHHYECV